MFKTIRSYESPNNALHVEHLCNDEGDEIVRAFFLPHDEILEVKENSRMFRSILSLMRHAKDVSDEWMKIADHTALADRAQVYDDLDALEMEEDHVIKSILLIAFGIYGGGRVDEETSYPDPIVSQIADRAIQQTISSDELEARLDGLFPPETISAAVGLVKGFETECDIDESWISSQSKFFDQWCGN